MTRRDPRQASTRATLALFTFGVLAVASGGCSDKGADPVPADGGPTAVSFAEDVQPVFDANCVGCHGAGGNGGLDLRAGGSHANLVGVASATWGTNRVTAGDAGASLLWQKMSGAAGVGSVMPPSGALASDTLDLVERWIAEGAEDN